MEPIYLDNNATTPVDPLVIRALGAALENFGNPSSAHPCGRRARAAIDVARQDVAWLLGCQPGEVIFTGGASESNNLALKGTVFSRGDVKRPHIVTTCIEHPAILAPCRFLESRGWAQVTVLPVDRAGRVDPAAVEEAITDDTVLISVMHANNEIGTIQPIAEIVKIAHQREIPVHCDAAQSIGKIPVRMADLDVDLLSVAGHKFYAPKGVGALIVRQGLRLEPLIHGASHEAGRRAGTENLPYIVALGKACLLAAEHLDSDGRRLRGLRDQLWRHLSGQLGERVELNGHPEKRLPNTLSINFKGVTGAEVLSACPGVAASTGPACHDGTAQLSHVLQALGVDPEVGKGAVRLSLGRFTTTAEVERAGVLLAEAFRSLTASQATG